MANRLIVFEDGKFEDFHPLTLSRPVFELRLGAWELWERIARSFPGYLVALACRAELAEMVARRTNLPVNQVDYSPGDRLVFVNGRLRLGSKLAQELKTTESNRIYHQGNITAAFVVVEPLGEVRPESLQFSGEKPPEMLGVRADIADGEFEFYEYLWNLVNLNADQIRIDFAALAGETDLAVTLKHARVDPSARILTEEDLFLAEGAEIGAGAVIDNRHGPVLIDRSAVVGPLSYVEGPCYIGPETRIFRGHIREGCSFGPQCRVGGEVEESIFQGYTNKYHDGFLGHAYLGSWVNLGAMTTNSDLKNNYGNIEVSIDGRIIDTGLMKVGSFIGDHSKTGIGMLINTGVVIGFSCNLYGGTLITSREVSSFSWGNESGYDIYRLERAEAVAQRAMARRNVTFSDSDRTLFARIFERTHGGQ